LRSPALVPKMGFVSGDDQDDVSVFRDRSVSYLELPAADLGQAAAFYSQAFGWQVRDNAFTDGSGHVIGHWRTDLSVAGDAGIRPYIYVTGIDAVLEQVERVGGAVIRPRYREGNLWVAHVRDPAGNVIGVWEHAG
jgi:predicted enzyme related to lactoylglutathione lyase